MSTRRSGFVALLMAFSLIAATCGDDDAGETTPAPATTQAPTTNTATAAVTTQPAATTSTSPAAESDRAADTTRFCEIDSEVDDTGEQLNSAETPAEVEAAYRYFVALAEEGVDVAPLEVRSDAEGVLAFMLAVTALLEDAGFDPLQVDAPAMDALLADEEAEAASDRMLDWIDANC